MSKEERLSIISQYLGNFIGPNFGYAYCPGETQNLVIDLDMKDKDPLYEGDTGIDGIYEWKILLEAEGLDPEAFKPQVTTPSGGQHIYFKINASTDFTYPIPTNASVIAPGIDVRGTGGYVVAAPSPGYIGQAPHEIEPYELPEALEPLILKAPKNSRNYRYDYERLEPALVDASFKALDKVGIIATLERLSGKPIKGLSHDMLSHDGWTPNFPCISPDHEDNNPSAGFNEQLAPYHCFSCCLLYTSPSPRDS